MTLVLTSADESRVRSMVFWLAGDLSWDTHPALGIGGRGRRARRGDAARAAPQRARGGDLRARSVGLDVSVWRALVYGIAAVLTAIAVVSAGTIGFVGLITPHFARLLFRTHDHRIIAPAAAVLGGTLLALADLVARTVAAPRQLPVGAIMAVVGTPLFLLLLRQVRAR